MAPFVWLPPACGVAHLPTHEEAMSRTFSAAVVAAAVALIPIRAQAQFTIKAGASFASTTESDLVPDVSNSTGFAAGIGYALKMGGKAFGLSVEALYVQKGGDLGDAGDLSIDEL